MITLTLAVIAWCSLWIWIGLRAAEAPPTPRIPPEPPGDAVIRRLANLVPPFVIVPCLLLALTLPQPAPPPSVAIRLFHYFGIVLLFLFLLAGAICQVRLWMQMRHHGPLASLAPTCRAFWILTRLMPAPAAVSILISGIRLAYESPLGNITYPWMFWLIVGFSFFFFDGLTFYLPCICVQYKALKISLAAGATMETFCRQHRSRLDEAMLLVHSLSLPLVFSLAYFRPMNLWIPRALAESIMGLFANWSPNAARAGAAITLVLLVGLLLLVVRLRRLVEQIQFLKAPPG